MIPPITTDESVDDVPHPSDVSDARGWLTDCGFAEELIDSLTDEHIVRFVDHEYVGGWSAFLLDIGRGDRPATEHGCAATPVNSEVLVQWTVTIAEAAALGALRLEPSAPIDTAHTTGSHR